MAEGVPYYFRRGQKQFVLYNFVDALQQVGILTLYGALDQTGDGILVTDTTASDKIEQWAAIAPQQAPYALFFDVDFDVTINAPITFEGIASINVPLKVDAATGAGSSALLAYADTVLRYVPVGGSETLIVSGATSVITGTGVPMTYDHERMMLSKVTVPKTTLNRGDVLRLTIHAWAKEVGGVSITGPYVIIAHDPKNRITTVGGDPFFTSPESTQLILNMPVKIVE